MNGMEMMEQVKSIHEPEAELLSAEEAVQDAARLSAVIRGGRRASERAVPVRVPLWALLEALDVLEPPELDKVAHRVQERLAAASRQ